MPRCRRAKRAVGQSSLINLVGLDTQVTWTVCDASGTETAQTHAVFVGSVAAMADKAATPWGQAVLVEELTLQQRAGDKRFSSVVQLLESPSGERLVRFAYSTDGTTRRGPVTLRARDIAKLREGLAKHPGLEETLKL